VKEVISSDGATLCVSACLPDCKSIVNIHIITGEFRIRFTVMQWYFFFFGGGGGCNRSFFKFGGGFMV